MKIATSITAAALAACIGFVSLPIAAPAEAGQVTVRIKPKGKQARALRTGLAIFGVIQGLQNKARVQQNGNNNAAGIAQNGSGNGALLVQDGSGHTGTITQNGNGNGCGLIQFGRNTNGSCAQNGNGNFDLILQGGW
jgi:Curlin associated repeat